MKPININGDGHESIPEISAEASLLAAALSKSTPGQVWRYEELNKIAGIDLQEKRGPLATARKKTQRESGLVFYSIAKVGIKCALPVDIVKASEGLPESIFRKVHRKSKEMACIKDEEYNQLTEDEKRRINRNISYAGAIMLASKSTNRERLDAAVKTANAKLLPNDVLDLFRKRD